MEKSKLSILHYTVLESSLFCFVTRPKHLCAFLALRKKTAQTTGKAGLQYKNDGGACQTPLKVPESRLIGVPQMSFYP